VICSLSGDLPVREVEITPVPSVRRSLLTRHRLVNDHVEAHMLLNTRARPKEDAGLHDSNASGDFTPAPNDFPIIPLPYYQNAAIA
jgi:hypothetical protein